MGNFCSDVNKKKEITNTKISFKKNSIKSNNDVKNIQIDYKLNVVDDIVSTNINSNFVRKRSAHRKREFQTDIVKKSDKLILNLANQNSESIIKEKAGFLDIPKLLYIPSQEDLSLNRNSHSVCGTKRSTSKPVSIDLESFIELTALIEHQRKKVKKRSKFI
jgi:hypothetical protein